MFSRNFRWNRFSKSCLERKRHGCATSLFSSQRAILLSVPYRDAKFFPKNKYQW